MHVFKQSLRRRVVVLAWHWRKIQNDMTGAEFVRVAAEFFRTVGGSTSYSAESKTVQHESDLILTAQVDRLKAFRGQTPGKKF